MAHLPRPPTLKVNNMPPDVISSLSGLRLALRYVVCFELPFVLHRICCYILGCQKLVKGNWLFVLTAPSGGSGCMSCLWSLELSLSLSVDIEGI